ncbi:MAG: histidine phosphatase family protein [Dehalococcoidia bacterium]|nr:histidine phosphatase family protein [Dehalococcoidia bacterium]
MTRLVLVRHGETTWNVTGYYQGRTDTDLSDRGRRQAARLAEHLRDMPLAAIYSSPLKRALDTIEQTAREAGQQVRVECGLTEIEHGLWGGLHKSEVEERYGETLRLWLENPTRAEVPGAESLEEVRDRVLETISDILGRHPNQTALVCTHDAVLKVLITSALGLGLGSFWAIQVDNASVSILQNDGSRAKLLLLNDTCHLGPERSDSGGQAL